MYIQPLNVNLLIPGGNKRSYVLKLTCSWRLKVCLSTYDLSLPPGIKGFMVNSKKNPLILASWFPEIVIFHLAKWSSSRGGSFILNNWQDFSIWKYEKFLNGSNYSFPAALKAMDRGECNKRKSGVNFYELFENPEENIWRPVRRLF